jgi:asparagine synthase (glutamine-hydrolysing)
MKDQLCGRIDLDRLFDPSEARRQLDSISLRASAMARDADAVCAVMGSPRFDDHDAANIALKSGLAAGYLKGWHKYGTDVASHTRGGYAAVVIDAAKGAVFLAVDRFAIETLCYSMDSNTLSFSDRADCVEGRGDELDPQAIFDFLFFHMIPAPRTIFSKVRRLPAAHSLLIDQQGIHEKRHWPLQFDEHHREPFACAKETFLSLVRDAVKEEISGEAHVGAFLSGGTDSSTIAGMLGQVTGKPAATYSIGFEAEGYDEMEYARIAARHFGCEHHEYYVTPGDLLASIPAVAQRFDQPFGNSSALPAYYCAQMAKTDGCTKILAGDGGDELFGGNSRYAMQRFLQFYHHVPQGLRQMVEPMCGDNSILRRVPGLRQAAGYVRHSRVPMPHRLENDNLLMQLDPAKALTKDLLARVDINEPAQHMQATWDECQAGALVNRMLAYDWRYTLADSDLPKVRGATAMAGILVGYPLLADRIADFSMTLQPEWKLKGFKLRWFFKEALRGFLPDAIITKKKHGFGLPYGPWMAKHPELRRLAEDSLNGLVERGMVQQDFVSEIFNRRLAEHPGYYGTMVWIMMMLEQWLRDHNDLHLPR